MMNSNTIIVDVREDLGQGREPFSRIMSAAAALQTNESLLLIAPFEPAPLFQVLRRQGFQYEVRQAFAGNWQVLFTRTAGDASTDCRICHNETRSVTDSPSFKDTAETATRTEIIRIDARGLEPPQPMVRILETLAALPLAAELQARTDRRPMHLYAQLEARSFEGKTEEQPDGSFITHIRRR